MFFFLSLSLIMSYDNSPITSLTNILCTFTVPIKATHSNSVIIYTSPISDNYCRTQLCTQHKFTIPVEDSFLGLYSK